MPEQGKAVGIMSSTVPQDRFPEVIAWMFPLIGARRPREYDPHLANGDAAPGVRPGQPAHPKGSRR